jgi:two-component system nitrogen regulation response regulator GlnG
VRELENLIRRLAALYSEEIIGTDIIEAELADAAPPSAGGTDLPSEVAGESLESAIAIHLQRYFATFPNGIPPGDLYARVLSELERPLLGLTLKLVRGNQVRAAALLGLNRNTLRKKIRQLDIEVVRGLK